MKIKESERDILKATRDILRLNNWYCIRHQQGLGSHPGMSDLTAVRGGRTIYVECKTARGIMRPAQLIFQAEITKRGAEYIVVRSVDDAIRMFNGT